MEAAWEDEVCNHGCGAVVARRRARPDRPRPAAIGSGMACAACTLDARIRPALELLRARGATPAVIDAWGEREQEHLEEHHRALAVDDSTLPMDERSRISGLSRAIRLVQQAIELRGIDDNHKLRRAVRRGWARRK